MSSDDAQAQAQACVPDELKHASAHDPDTFEYGDRPASSVFARDGAPVHNVPMAVIRRPLPSELDEAKVAAFMEEMQNGDAFTPIEVVKVQAPLRGDPGGKVHNFYFSMGGCHRFEATKRLGWPTIRARIIQVPPSNMRIYLGAACPF